jgi:hypothetical protein
MAGEYTCAERINYLIKEKKQSQWDACWRVAGLEYEDVCGPCNPGVHYNSQAEKKAAKENKKMNKDAEVVKPDSLHCGPCSQELCDSDLNRCPVFKRTFVCTDGSSLGGCAGDPQIWLSDKECGELTLLVV